MGGPAGSLEWAAAAALADLGLVAERDVEQDQWGGWAQRGQQQGVRWERHRAWASRAGRNDGVEIVKEVDLVRCLRLQAPLADEASFHAAVVGQGRGANRADRGQADSGDRLTTDRNVGTGQVDPSPLGGLTQLGRRAWEGEQVWSVADVELPVQPGYDRQWVAWWYVDRARERQPSRAATPAEQACTPSVAWVQQGAGRVKLRRTRRRVGCPGRRNAGAGSSPRRPAQPTSRVASSSRHGRRG